MSRQKLRRIVIGPDTYLWRVHHRHVAPAQRDGRGCTEVFTAFLENFPKAPARVLFPETPEHGPGYPSQSGVVVDYRRPTQAVNLNHPRIARLVIELALAANWSPTTGSREFVLPNGYELFRAHPTQLDEALAASRTHPRAHEA